jgi:hypothetical protein
LTLAILLDSGFLWAAFISFLTAPVLAVIAFAHLFMKALRLRSEALPT